MKLPSSCLGVLNLRQGSFVIGVVQLTINCLSLVGFIITWAVLSSPAGGPPSVDLSTAVERPPSTVDIPQPDGSIITQTTGPLMVHSEEALSSNTFFALLFGPAVLVSLVHVAFSVVLVVGARREQPCLLLTWLVYQAVVLVLSLLSALATFVLALHMSEYVLLAAVGGVLGGSVLLAFCFVVVLAYRRELLRGPTHTVVVRQPDMVKMVNIA
ncbi:hypothetical protein FJT64_018325 [Amphibalanus amphitrite]|uniref:Uncharacterized protein n=1 Tax=Amphibalanus amphitrite TaxID=1232801 RepID=A0A6A4X791_AMPAM|nr:hypothetical protein FJT64_018325 [Amphibalanus amphitrite]